MALCVCLTPQLCSALVGGLPQILADTIVPSAPVPSLPGSAVTGESFFVGDTVQRDGLSLCLWLSVVVSGVAF